MFVRCKRSLPDFVVWAIFFGLLMVAGGIAAIVSSVQNEKTGMIGAFIFMIIVGVILLATAIYFCITCFSHQKKVDPSVPLNINVTINGAPAMISTPQEIIDAYGRLNSGGEMVVNFIPAYGNLVNWKFIRIKNQYITLPTIQKKNGALVTYFIMPRPNPVDAVKWFMEVYIERKTLDKSMCIPMKKYGAMIEMYGLK